jgi:hypothetical protein
MNKIVSEEKVILSPTERKIGIKSTGWIDSITIDMPFDGVKTQLCIGDTAINESKDKKVTFSGLSIPGHKLDGHLYIKLIFSNPIALDAAVDIRIEEKREQPVDAIYYIWYNNFLIYVNEGGIVVKDEKLIEQVKEKLAKELEKNPNTTKIISSPKSQLMVESVNVLTQILKAMK